MSQEDKAKLIDDQASFVNSAKENGVRTMRLPDLLVQLGYKRTESLSRSREELAAGERQAAASKTSVGTAPVMPVFTNSTDEIIPGSVLPYYKEGSEEQKSGSSLSLIAGQVQF